MSGQAITPAPEFTPAQSRSYREQVAYTTYQARVDAAWADYNQNIYNQWQKFRTALAAADHDFAAALAQLRPPGWEAGYAAHRV